MSLGNVDAFVLDTAAALRRWMVTSVKVGLKYFNAYFP